MNRGKMVFAATVLSLMGGVLNLLVSVIRLPAYPWFLTSISALVTLFAALFLYWDSHNRALWGGVIFLYSNLGFISFGVSPERHLLPYGFATLILGIIGGALGIHESKAGLSKTEQ
jgi:hypothetical protein